MKIVTIIARILLGLMFVVFGLNGIHPFMPMGPMPAGPAGQYMAALAAVHYMVFVCSLMVISGVLFLAGRFVPLALTLLGPILVNILLFHALFLHAGFQPGVLATLLWLIVFWRHRAAFAGIFQAKA
jgi:putative oxidoreductase